MNNIMNLLFNFLNKPQMKIPIIEDNWDSVRTEYNKLAKSFDFLSYSIVSTNTMKHIDIKSGIKPSDFVGKELILLHRLR